MWIKQCQPTFEKCEPSRCLPLSQRSFGKRVERYLGVDPDLVIAEHQRHPLVAARPPSACRENHQRNQHLVKTCAQREQFVNPPVDPTRRESEQWGRTSGGKARSL
jgi:hypothetical protein